MAALPAQGGRLTFRPGAEPRTRGHRRRTVAELPGRAAEVLAFNDVSHLEPDLRWSGCAPARRP
ncbi:hypothetical protein HFP72_34235 [Nocardiopsis sp. ARC36]